MRKTLFFLEMEASILCEKHATQCVAMILGSSCLPLRRKLLAVSLVEGNSGREPQVGSQIPNWKETRRQQHVISLTVVPFLIRSAENQRACSLSKGLGRQALVQDLCTYRERPKKQITYATERSFTEIHLPLLTLENPTNFG